MVSQVYIDFFLSSLITVWFDDSKQPIKKIMCHIFMCLLWIDNCARWTSSLFNILLPTIKDVCWQLFTRWLKFLTSIDGILLDRNKICAHVFYNNKHLIGGNIWLTLVIWLVRINMALTILIGCWNWHFYIWILFSWESGIKRFYPCLILRL